MKLLFGVDIGTTAEKVALYDNKGNLLALSSKEYDLLTPEVDYVEVDPKIYWEALKEAIADLKGQYTWDDYDEAALAISAQGETLFFLDKYGEDLRNAIVWMDNRATAEANKIREHFSDERCYSVTGQVSFEACWPASKIMWVRDHEPEVFKSTDKFALIEDYFIYKMTGKMVTEGSLVCSSTYWDITRKEYWKEMLDYIGIHENQLPEVMESGELVGDILPQTADYLGLPVKTKICTGCLDQVAGAIGSGTVKQGMMSENIGAALAICVPTSKPCFDPNRKMPVHYFAIPDTYMIHTFTNGGMTLRWYRDKMCQTELEIAKTSGKDAYDVLSDEAASVPAGSDGLVMLPHLAGSLAPDVNTRARGVWYGFTIKHTKAHFTRSIMESLGYIIKRNLKNYKKWGLK